MQHVLLQKPDFAMIQVVFEQPGEQLLVSK
jgi:hypothetical protein